MAKGKNNTLTVTEPFYISDDEFAYLFSHQERCEKCNHLCIFHDTINIDLDELCRVGACGCGTNTKPLADIVMPSRKRSK